MLLVKKNFEDNSNESIYKIIKGKEQIDLYLGEEYTEEKIRNIL
jgi:hypothetical protein